MNLHQTQNLTDKELKKFAWVLAIGFGIIGLFKTIKGNHLFLWLVGLAVLCLIVGFVKPRYLVPVHKYWLKLGGILGWVNTNIILIVLFFVTLTPIAFLMKILGRDSMSRKFDKKSVTYSSPSKKRKSNHFKFQY